MKASRLFIYFCNKSSVATTEIQNHTPFFVPTIRYSSAERAVRPICRGMEAMRHFHVPGVFDLKTDLMIAGAALVITYVLYRFNWVE